MTTSYRRPTATATNYKDGATPYSTPISGDIQPISVRGGRKLLDQFRDKMRSLHYALATEKAYRHWIVEFLRFHRDGGEWRHPAHLSAEVVFPACNLVGRQLKEDASTSADKAESFLTEVITTSAPKQAAVVRWAAPTSALNSSSLRCGEVLTRR